MNLLYSFENTRRSAVYLLQLREGRKQLLFTKNLQFQP